MERNRKFLPGRIVILRALQLGDLLCSVPAFRALRYAIPQAEIVLLGLPWARSFVKRYSHYLDGFIEFPGCPGLPEQPVQVQRIPAFLEEIQSQDFELAIQLQGSGYITNPLVTLFGASHTAGFYLPEQYCPDEENFLPYPDDLPEPKRHLALMEYLGFPSQGDELEFPLNTTDRTEFERMAEIFGLEPGRFVLIHPGARAPERRWEPASFAVVADWLAVQGLEVVLTGTEAESGLAAQVIKYMKFPAHNLTGRTSLGGLAYLIHEACLLVSNDTGPSHIAAALEVPSVILFSASDPNRWAPLNRKLHRVIEEAKGVSPETVIHEVSTLLYKVNVYAE